MFQLSRKDCRKVTETNGRYKLGEQYRPLLEVTTSGLTHSFGTTPCARPKENFICSSPYFQRATRMAAHWAHLSGAWTELVHIDRKQEQEGANYGIQYSISQNFAEFEFDWDEQEVTVRAFGNDPNISPLSSTTWNFTYLTAPNHHPNLPFLKPSDFLEKFRRLVLDGFVESGDWICINNRGPISFTRKLYGVVGPTFIICSAMLFPLVIPIVVMVALMKSKGKNGKKTHTSLSRQSSKM